MALYAISDLHLALSGDKPMDVFGENWYKHDEKIKINWSEKISSEDTVLIGGDVSWSIRMEEGMKDIQWIHELPGRKIISKGNHDYWWGSINKLNGLYEDIKFVQNNFYLYGDYAICGTRGWTCPGSEKYTAHDDKIYKRELIRLRLSLESAKIAGYSKYICMIHYPPTNERFETSGFTEIFEEYSVETVIYGHLHGNSLNRVLNRDKNGVRYVMTSSDYLDFNPIKIYE